MLGEDDQLLPRRRGRLRDLAGAVRHVRFRDARDESAHGEDLTEQAGKLAPLGVGAAAPHLQREGFERLERLDLGLQLGDGTGRRRLIEHLLLGRLDLVLGRLVQVLHILGVELRTGEGKRDGGLSAALQHLELAQSALQSLAAAAQRLVDGRGRRRQPALENGQREADGAGAPVVLERLRTVELLAHVVGDVRVQTGLRVREPVRDGVRDALREQRRGVELEQVLLHHAPHQVGDLRDMNPVAKAPLESVAVDERHEELKVLLLPVVRGRGHQEEVAGEARQELAQPIALRVLDLAAEERRRHLVRLVAHDEVPAAIRRLQLVLDVLVAGELVEPRNDEVGFQEPVAGACRFELVVRQDVEGQMEPAVKLVLPLLRETAGTDDETALQVSAGDQLLDEQPRHDGLAGARVVGEQEADGLPGQHGFVDRGDLMRQRLDDRRVHGEHGVEEMGEADPLRLGDEAEQGAVAVEAPGSPDFDDLEPGLVVTVQQLVGDLAGRRLVGQLERFGAEPLHADHRDEAVGQNAAHRGVGLKIFQLHALLLFFRHFHRIGSAPWRSPGAVVAQVFGLSMIAAKRLPFGRTGPNGRSAMDVNEFRASASDARPPDGLSPALMALWHLARGEWDSAHGHAQSDSGRDGAWVHAHLHRVEGDLANAGYWYRRADRPPCEASLDDEWEEIAAALLAAK